MMINKQASPWAKALLTKALQKSVAGGAAAGKATIKSPWTYAAGASVPYTAAEYHFPNHPVGKHFNLSEKKDLGNMLVAAIMNAAAFRALPYATRAGGNPIAKATAIGGAFGSTPILEGFFATGNMGRQAAEGNEALSGALKKLEEVTSSVQRATELAEGRIDNIGKNIEEGAANIRVSAEEAAANANEMVGVQMKDEIVETLGALRNLTGTPGNPGVLETTSQKAVDALQSFQDTVTTLKPSSGFRGAIGTGAGALGGLLAGNLTSELMHTGVEKQDRRRKALFRSGGTALGGLAGFALSQPALVTDALQGVRSRFAG